jgi:Arc/MetJ family transcription regulator
MRTTVDIDENLVRRALSASGARTKTQVLELGLKTLIDVEARRCLVALRGQLTSGRPPRRRRAFA